MNCYYMCVKKELCVCRGGGIALSLSLSGFYCLFQTSICAHSSPWRKKKTLLFCHQWRQMLVISRSPFPAFNRRSHLQWKLIRPLNTL